MIKTRKCEPIGRRVSRWGEGPVWHDHGLWYVDIEGHTVVRFEPETGIETAYSVGERVGFVVPCRSGGLVVGGESGIRDWDAVKGAFRPLADPEGELRGQTRFNDGKCDPSGRLWAGTLSFRRMPECALYRVDPDGTVTRHIEGLTNSNGLAWSADGRTMYHIDTATRQVRAFDFDIGAGTLSRARVVVDAGVLGLEGSLDGMAIDVEGLLWVALCHGGAIYRFDPSSGQAVAKVLVPAEESTSCAFGGECLDTLFITTGLPKSGASPGDGILYACTPGVAGQPVPVFAR